MPPHFLTSPVCRADFDIPCARPDRYADDRNIYVGSERAGQRVMHNITRFLTTELRLKVNEDS